jgi:hypothetical protein
LTSRGDGAAGALLTRAGGQFTSGSCEAMALLQAPGRPARNPGASAAAPARTCKRQTCRAARVRSAGSPSSPTPSLRRSPAPPAAICAGSGRLPHHAPGPVGQRQRHSAPIQAGPLSRHKDRPPQAGAAPPNSPSLGIPPAWLSTARRPRRPSREGGAPSRRSLYLDSRGPGRTASSVCRPACFRGSKRMALPAKAATTTPASLDFLASDHP